MKRAFIGVFLGAVLYFVWGAVSWMALPFHDKTIKTLPEERLIRDTLKTVVTESGLYMFPSDKTATGRMDQNDWNASFKSGPNGVLAYDLGGKDPMGPGVFLRGFLIDFLIAGLAMLVLIISRDRVRTMGGRFLVVTALGFLAWVTVHVSYWNWFFFPGPYTLVTLMDCVVGYGLLGLVLPRFLPRD